MSERFFFIGIYLDEVFDIITPYVHFNSRNAQKNHLIQYIYFTVNNSENFFNLNKFQAVKFSTRIIWSTYDICYITCKKQIVLSILHHNQTPWDHNHLVIRHLMHRLRNLARALLPHKTFQFHCYHHLAHHRIGYLKHSLTLTVPSSQRLQESHLDQF